MNTNNSADMESKSKSRIKNIRVFNFPVDGNDDYKYDEQVEE